MVKIFLSALLVVVSGGACAPLSGD